MHEALPRVLHINLARGWRGGEQQTWLLMQALAGKGYVQGLCAYPESPIATAARSLDNVRIVPPGRCLAFPWRVGDWTIAHAHEARGVYVAWWLKRLRGIRYIVTRRMQQAPRDRFVTRLAYQQADKLVGISSAACESMHSLAPGHEIACIPSAHSGRLPDREAAAAIRRNLIQEPGATLIGHAGALRDSHKGQRVLIEATKRLRALGYPVEVIFFGEGPDRNTLENETSALHWIRFVGQVSPIQDHLAAVDLFAFPSRHEGLGSVLLEAMLAEVPVIATRVGGIPDIIEDSASGLLVEPNDPVALCDAVGELIDNPKRADRFIAHALHIAESMRPEAMGAQYAEIYEAYPSFLPIS